MKRKQDKKKNCYNCQYYDKDDCFCYRHSLKLQTKSNSIRFYCTEFTFNYNKVVKVLDKEIDDYKACIKEIEGNYDRL